MATVAHEERYPSGAEKSLSKLRWSNAKFQLYGGKQRTVATLWVEVSVSGSGTIGSRGVPVKQMQREARKQFLGRVVLVHEFRTNRVSSARTNVVHEQVESFSNVMKRKFYDQDVSTALNIRRIATRPNRPAMPNRGGVGREWVEVRDKGLLRSCQRRHQRQR
ncbi:hypothetical protein QJQ45_005912 [Haematococcus lacustris]|nr:hypothetical protein QJQ45_005912 [Haematococcus lacustris]